MQKKKKNYPGIYETQKTKVGKQKCSLHKFYMQTWYSRNWTHSEPHHPCSCFKMNILVDLRLALGESFMEPFKAQTLHWYGTNRIKAVYNLVYLSNINPISGVNHFYASLCVTSHGNSLLYVSSDEIARETFLFPHGNVRVIPLRSKLAGTSITSILHLSRESAYYSISVQTHWIFG